MDEKHLIKMINEDLKNTCKINEIPFNIKFTMEYKRYTLNKQKIQKLLNNIDSEQYFLYSRLFLYLFN